MKINISSDHFSRKKSDCKALINIMKICLLFLFAFTFQLMAINTNAQDAVIKLKSSSITIGQLINEIEKQTDYLVVYSNREIDTSREINDVNTNDKVSSYLEKVFGGTNIGYNFENNYIVLSQKAKENTNAIAAILQSTQKIITGIVSDEDGEPIIGANIVEKGTTNGTITDIDGNFTFRVGEGAILQITYIGYHPYDISTLGRSHFDIVLSEDTQSLEELVVIGYGTVNRQAVTGAVSKANLTPYENVAVNNVLERIKGTVAGVNINGITSAGHVPGIVIRGQNSTGAKNNPLIVVDGAIFHGSLGDIAPGDIKNLTVLKDASAAAVYGSRSANGVIIIDTKMGGGKNGKPVFNVNANIGISNELEPLEIYDAHGYIEKLADYMRYTDPTATFEDAAQTLTGIQQINYNATPDHQPTIADPYGITRQLGKIVNTNISVSNTMDKVSYYASANIVNQKGIVLNNEYKHFSGRINITSDLTDWLKIGVKSQYSLKDYSGSSPSTASRVMLSPYGSIYDEDGNVIPYPMDWVGAKNPFYSISTDDVDRRNYLNSIVTGTILVPWVKGLSYDVMYSNTMNWTERFQFFGKNTDVGEKVNGQGARIYDRTYSMLLDNLIRYNREFNNLHKVDVTLLYSREHSAWENLRADAQDFTNDLLGTYALENGAAQTVNTGGGETNGIGMMARGTYTYNDKYALTGTIRRDGYSAFSKNKKWGNFPSVAFRWNVAGENFMKNAKVFDDLALRVSYGINGNQSIDAYQTLARMGTNRYLFNGESLYTITQHISALANNDLGWESTTGLNLGMDFAILKNRLNGSIDVYKSKTNDLLFELPLPNISGAGKILANVGEIQNKGIEVNLHSLNIDKKNFKWESYFAFSLNRNKVASILGEDKDGDGKEDDLISAGYFIGKSLGTIYAYKVIGMWQQEDEDNGTIMKGLRPGDYKLEDVNIDGKMTSDQDRQFLGSTKENFRWSWTNTFTYKDFSLMAYVYSIWGGNGWYQSTTNNPATLSGAEITVGNFPVYDYWTASNPNARFPRLDYTTAPFRGVKYMDRSFIKLQKISLTYNATKFVKQWGINDLKISLSGDNLFTYAPYWVGLDPETDDGLTRSSEPTMRNYLISVSFNF